MSKLYRKINNKYVEVGDDCVLSEYTDHIKFYGAHLIINTRKCKSYISMGNKDVHEVTERILENIKICAVSEMISREIYSKVFDDIFKEDFDKSKFNSRREFIEYLLDKERFTFPSDCTLVNIILNRLCEYDSKLYMEDLIKKDE